jgi:hypothetical protein
MSQRNRLAVATLALSAALFLASPAPSHASGFRQERLPVAGFLERVWDWMTELWPAGGPSGPAARWEKEGGAINPNGQSNTASGPPRIELERVK